MAILLEDLRNVYSFQIDVVNQLEEEFGDDFDDVENEFNEFWESLLKDQIIKYASRGDGKFAGTGSIDYNEAKVIYLFIRTRKPRNVLEIGFASGVSSTLIAKALEVNGEANIKGITRVNADAQYLDSYGVVKRNRNSISENLTIGGADNAASYGPITIASGFTVTISSGGVWNIL